MVKRPEVSIICCTYNHEPYIRDALDSLLAQKTSFSIEILIHDDASTDNTAAIIEEYAKAYPYVVKPMYQKENQYSKGIDVRQVNYERARGKYITFCDGDDFWIDQYKLQRQYDYLEKTKNCVLSVHASKIVDENGQFVGNLCAPSKMNRFYDTPELIKRDGNLFVKSSMFFRANVVKNRPSLFMNAPMKDYVFILYLSLFGQVHFMRDVMSCHRMKAPEFWSSAHVASGELDKQDAHGIGEWLLQFDEWTNYSFHEAIESKLHANGFIFTQKQNELKKMDAPSLRQMYATMPLKSKVVLFVERSLPQLAITLKRKRMLMYQLLYRRH